MRPHVFGYLILAMAMGAGPAPSGQDEHKDLNSKVQRPDRQVSELTQSVASKLPRAVSTNAKPAIVNLIDEHLFGAMEKAGIAPAAVCGDQEFCRRVYLDLTGRIPTVEQLGKFVASASADKRNKLID